MAISHRGRLEGYPPYVGGDDDEIDEWQADCACGYKGRRTPHVSVAYGELVLHLNLALADHDREEAAAAR